MEHHHQSGDAAKILDSKQRGPFRPRFTGIIHREAVYLVSGCSRDYARQLPMPRKMYMRLYTGSQIKEQQHAFDYCGLGVGAAFERDVDRLRWGQSIEFAGRGLAAGGYPTTVRYANAAVAAGNGGRIDLSQRRGA